MLRSVFNSANLKSISTVAAGAAAATAVGVTAYRLSRPAITNIRSQWDTFKREGLHYTTGCDSAGASVG